MGMSLAPFHHWPLLSNLLIDYSIPGECRSAFHSLYTHWTRFPVRDPHSLNSPTIHCLQLISHSLDHFRLCHCLHWDLSYCPCDLLIAYLCVYMSLDSLLP